MRLDEIKAIISAATPGPWEWKNDEMIGYEPFTDGSKGKGFTVAIIKTDSGVYPPEENDRRFIAAARTLLPALLEVAEKANLLFEVRREWGEPEAREDLDAVPTQQLKAALAALEALKLP